MTQEALKQARRMGKQGLTEAFREASQIASIIACRDALDAQPVPRRWVGLTDEERESIANATIRIHGQEWAYATAIEARLKEKNA